MPVKESNFREKSKPVRTSNLERLKIALSYLSELKLKGEISDKGFETLVKYACSLFLANEVEAKIESALERKLIKFFDSRFSETTQASFTDVDLSKLLAIK